MFYWIKFIDTKETEKLREDEILHRDKVARSNYN